MAGPNGRAQQPLPLPEKAIWKSDLRNGFEPGVQTLTLEAGANYGLAAFGSRQARHLALASLSYGRLLTGVVNDDHWYRGNLEFRAELFYRILPLFPLAYPITAPNTLFSSGAMSPGLALRVCRRAGGNRKRLERTDQPAVHSALQHATQKLNLM